MSVSGKETKGAPRPGELMGLGGRQAAGEQGTMQSVAEEMAEPRKDSL